MAILAGRFAVAADLAYPGVVTDFGNGTNTISATSFSVLPGTPCSASITNPHPTASMLTLVSYGAWLVATTNTVRISLDITGSVTIAAGSIGGGAAAGYGEIPYLNAAPGGGQNAATITVEVPPGTATFEMWAMRTTSGSQQVNYPTIRLVPLRYIF